MSKRRFYLVLLSALLTIFILFGLAACGDQKNKMVLASADSSVSVDDSHFVLTSQGLYDYIPNSLCLQYSVSRRYMDEMTTKIQTFSTSTDGYSYYSEGYAEYDFELSLDKINRFTWVKLLVMKDYVYFYINESSATNADAVTFWFSCFGYGDDVFISGNHVSTQEISSPKTYDNFKCVKRLNNRNSQVLPFSTENNFIIRVYGQGLDPILSYDLRMDYTICGFGNGTYSERFAKDGWEWLGKHWSWQVAKNRYISTTTDYTKSNSEKVDVSNSEYFPAGLSIQDRSISSECYSVFENQKFLNGAEANPEIVFLSSYDYAYDLAYNYSLVSITVQYLQNIPGTPFAYQYNQTLDVRLKGDEELISWSVIASAFKEKNVELPLVVCNSTLDYFILSDKNSNLYTAYYRPSQQIFLKTQDGNVSYITVDCNKTFNDYFAPFKDYSTDKGAFLDVVLNDIVLQKYGDILQNYELNLGDKLYGRWGWAIMPQTLNVLNEILVGDLNVTSTQGVKYYTLQGTLSRSNYENLLKSFNYSDLSIAGNNLANYFDSNVSNCTYYVFFTEADDYKGGIGVGDNPSDEDDDPAFKDKVQDTLSDFKDWFKDLFNGDKPKFDWVKTVTIIAITLLSGAGIVLGIKSIFGGKKQ